MEILGLSCVVIMDFFIELKAEFQPELATWEIFVLNVFVRDDC